MRDREPERVTTGQANVWKKRFCSLRVSLLFSYNRARRQDWILERATVCERVCVRETVHVTVCVCIYVCQDVALKRSERGMDSPEMLVGEGNQETCSVVSQMLIALSPLEDSVLGHQSLRDSPRAPSPQATCSPAAGQRLGQLTKSQVLWQGMEVGHRLLPEGFSLALCFPPLPAGSRHSFRLNEHSLL